MIHQRAYPWFLPVFVGIYLSLAACAPVIVQPEHVRAGPADRGPVVIIQSGLNRLYETPIKTLTRQVEAAVDLFNAAALSKRNLVASVRARHPSVIVALGGQAALIARDNFDDVPVLFAMVVNYQQYD